jgi:hypothetical protein
MASLHGPGQVQGVGPFALLASTAQRGGRGKSVGAGGGGVKALRAAAPFLTGAGGGEGGEQVGRGPVGPGRVGRLLVLSVYRRRLSR